MPDSLFTREACRHIGLMTGALGPHRSGLEKHFRKWLRVEEFTPGQVGRLAAILPTAAMPLSTFRDRVQSQGRLLAKLNLSIEQADAALRRFDVLAAEALEGRFAPPREQLLLATLHHLHLAFYQVREAEAQVFFAISRAETEAGGLDDLLRRIVSVLTRTFGARTGRLMLGGKPVSRRRACLGRAGLDWSYPLAALGELQLTFVKPRCWLPRELALLEAVAARCEEAIERARRESTIRRLETEARAAEEDERHRIGRELHDEAGQALMVLRLRLEMIERQAPLGLRDMVAEAREIAEDAIVELRQIISALSPAVLERLGLESALRQLGARFRKNHPAALRVRIAGNGKAVPKPVQEVVYRVAQECLQNVVKHSGASHVNLSLHAADSRVRLSVSDDGVGFRIDAAQAKPMSFGLAGMRERAALLGGNLKIRSAVSKGTTVTLELPIQPAKEK